MEEKEQFVSLLLDFREGGFVLVPEANGLVDCEPHGHFVAESLEDDPGVVDEVVYDLLVGPST